MKVIYLHQYFKTPDENGGTRSYDLSKEFVVNGLEVEVITTTSNPDGFVGNKWRSEEINGVKVNYLYLPYENSFSFYKRIWVFFVFILFSTMKLLKTKGDVVLATSTPLTIGIPALIKRFFHRTPYIFEVRDIWPEAVIAIGAIKNKFLQKALYSFEYFIYKYAIEIVALSMDMRRSILNRYPEFKSKSNVVIENISEIERFKSYTVDEFSLKNVIGFDPKISILYAGTFGIVNNLDYVLELAAKIIKFDESIIFLLLGNGSERGVLQKKAKFLNVYNRNVFFLDAVGKNTLPSIYNAVDIGSSFVANIPELWANSANKYFDTLAAGKPILINHYGWQSEVIQKERIGFVLDPEINDLNIQDFLKFVNDEDSLKLMGQNAKQIAINHYSLYVAVNKYLNIFKNITI